MTFRLLHAFLHRDWQYESSYRGMLILQLFGSLGSLILFYAIGKLVNDAEPLERYGGQYFPFALVGLIVSDYFTVGLRSFANRLRLAQTTGTLEAMFMSQTSAGTILLYSGLWDFLFATGRLAVAIAIGVAAMDVRFSVNPLPALILAVLSLVSFASLGLLAAALILVIKRGDAVATFGGVFATVFAGTLFPVSLLPDWIRPIAYLLPLQYALDGLRRTLLVNASLDQVMGDLLVLAGSVLLLVPGALLTVRWATTRVRRDGSLGHH
jgi:ABC-2 type transport system permease protein